MYLHNYQVLDHGLICKNNPKWGLVLLALGPDGHLLRHPGLFFCHTEISIKMARPISFLLIVILCCVVLIYLPQPPPLFFCPIVFVIVCNAEGRPEERGGRDRPHRLEQSFE